MAHYLTQESALRVNGLCAEVYGDLVLRADDHIFTQGGEEYINCGGVVFDDPGAHAVQVLFGELEHGLFLAVLVGGTIAGADKAFDLGFYGDYFPSRQAK